MNHEAASPASRQPAAESDRTFLGLLPTELEAFSAWLSSQGAVAVVQGRTDTTAWVRWEEGPMVRSAIRAFLDTKQAHKAIEPPVEQSRWRMVAAQGYANSRPPAAAADHEAPIVRVGEDRVRWGVPWGAPNLSGVTKIECSRRGDPLRESIAWHRILASAPAASAAPDVSDIAGFPGSQSGTLAPSPTFRPAPFQWAIVVVPWHHEVPDEETQYVVDALGMFRDNPKLDDQRGWFLAQVAAVEDTTPGQQHWGAPAERMALMRRLEVGLSHWDQLAYPMRHWVERLLAHPGIVCVADRDLIKACLAHHEPQIRLAGLRLLGETDGNSDHLPAEARETAP